MVYQNLSNFSFYKRLLHTHSLTYSGHGDHQKIDTVPVCEASDPILLVIIRKIRRVPAIFKLQTKSSRLNNRVCPSDSTCVILCQIMCR